MSLEQGSVKGLLHLFLGYMSCPVVSEQFNSVKKNTKKQALLMPSKQRRLL